MYREEFIAITICIALMCFAIWAGIHSSNEWEEFSKNHHCKEVAHITGDIFSTFGVSANGQPSIGVGATPDKTGWLCDDGITYYR